MNGRNSKEVFPRDEVMTDFPGAWGKVGFKSKGERLERALQIEHNP